MTGHLRILGVSLETLELLSVTGEFEVTEVRLDKEKIKYHSSQCLCHNGSVNNAS